MSNRFVTQIEVEILDYEKCVGTYGTDMMFGFITGSISALHMAGVIDVEERKTLSNKINDAYHKRYQEENK